MADELMRTSSQDDSQQDVSDVSLDGCHQLKTIIAVDASRWSEYAFTWYARHLHVPGTDVICLHQTEMPHISTARMDVITADAYNIALQGCKDAAKRVEDKFVKLMDEFDITGQFVVKYGSQPGEVIVEMARVERASMIVTGTRGIGKLRRTVLGSVSDYVLHHAHCPVIICSHGAVSRGYSISESESTPYSPHSP